VWNGTLRPHGGTRSEAIGPLLLPLKDAKTGRAQEGEGGEERLLCACSTGGGTADAHLLPGELHGSAGELLHGGVGSVGEEMSHVFTEDRRVPRSFFHRNLPHGEGPSPGQDHQDTCHPPGNRARSVRTPCPGHT